MSQPKEDKKEEVPIKPKEFRGVTVNDCIRLKISPKDYYPTEQFRVNMSWVELLALFNQNSLSGNKMDGTMLTGDVLKTYTTLMNESGFL